MTQAADLKLAAVFSDHMVLQRELPIAVWGWADPGESVTVSFAGKSETARRARTGNGPSNSTPFRPARSLARSSPWGKDGRKVEVRDVVVGEVWLCAGQSNMAMTVDGPTKWLHVGGYRECEGCGARLGESVAPTVCGGLENRHGPAARLHGKMEHRWTGRHGELLSDPVTFFARELQQRLKVPVGILKRVVRGFIGGRLDEPRGTHEIRGCRVRWENEPASVTTRTTSNL